MEHADNINYKPNWLAEIVRLCWLCYDDKCFLAYMFFSCKKKCLTLTRLLDNRLKVEIKICEMGTKTSTSFAGTPAFSFDAMLTSHFLLHTLRAI